MLVKNKMHIASSLHRCQIQFTVDSHQDHRISHLYPSIHMHLSSLYCEHTFMYIAKVIEWI